jgi:DNA polymerase-2
MRVWAALEDGGRESFLDPWRPAFHLAGGRAALDLGLRALAGLPFPHGARRVERLDLFSGRALPVLEIRTPPLRRDAAARALQELGCELYGADVPLAQAYHYERGHFPLARCAFEAAGGALRGWALQDDPWALDYELPPLRSAHLFLSASEIAGPLDPKTAPRGRLAARFEGVEHEFEGALEDQIDALSARLEEWDPDVLTTDWGDGWLLPRLAEAAARSGREPPLSRDPRRAMARTGPESFRSYGRMLRSGGRCTLFGRWHLDLRNSFLLRETGLDGLLEIARIAKVPVQRAARSTIGTSLASMQMDRAWRDGILVPMEKRQAEAFRPASDLLECDKGGLVYEPETGWHGLVAEYDFVSMYPTIMARRNISPETVDCPCCAGGAVPGTGHRLCSRRRGLVPKVLEPLLAKRSSYKLLAKAPGPMREAYKRRSSAHKWCLVTCFGYLGFKNARFGRIEAHECVTAWGRELLLRAKEAVEERGLRVLHALTDSLWVRLEPGADPEEIRRAVEARAGAPVGLEGVYKWIRFCPSKRDALSGVPGRYFGAFLDGEIKVRGLACRRRDTPELLKGMQEEMLRRLAGAADPEGCRRLARELLEMAEERRRRLREGAVTAQDLAIALRASKEACGYARDTRASLAARMLAAAGSPPAPGETVRFVIASAKDEVKDWRVRPLSLLEDGLEYDAGEYARLLDRAAWEILDGLAPREEAGARPRPRQLELFPPASLVYNTGGGKP